jgi:hypothetical protein
VRGVAAEHWDLDPAGFDEVWARDRDLGFPDLITVDA